MYEHVHSVILFYVSISTPKYPHMKNLIYYLGLFVLLLCADTLPAANLPAVAASEQHNAPTQHASQVNKRHAKKVHKTKRVLKRHHIKRELAPQKAQFDGFMDILEDIGTFLLVLAGICIYGTILVILLYVLKALLLVTSFAVAFSIFMVLALGCAVLLYFAFQYAL